MMIRKILFRNGRKNSSPRWAFMEAFEVPDFDNPEVTYLTRLRIVQTPLFGIYIHRLGTPDARKSLHNHPFAFLSILLRGEYTEMIPCNCGFDHCDYYAVPRRVRFINIKRFNNSYHWIDEIHREPVWTLVFVGRRRRVWGYLERDGTRYNFDESPYNDAFEKALADCRNVEVTYEEGPLDWGDDSPCAHHNDPCEYCGKDFPLGWLMDNG